MKHRLHIPSKYYLLEQRWNLDQTAVSGICYHYQQRLDDATGFKFDGAALFRRDNRTDAEYLYDLIDGWTSEDLIELWLYRKLGPCFSRRGCDKDRIIRIDSVTSEPDFDLFEVQLSDRKLPIYHIRKSKGDRMKQDGHLCLTIVLETHEYFFTHPDDLGVAKPNPVWGNKLCYEVVPSEYGKMKD